MRFFGLKTCDTCRKALRRLAEAGHRPDVVDVRDDGVLPGDLARFLQTFGHDLVNRRSTTWRALTQNERGGDPLSLLERHPTLMKRPVIEDDTGKLYLGWNTAVEAAVLDANSGRAQGNGT